MTHPVSLLLALLLAAVASSIPAAHAHAAPQLPSLDDLRVKRDKLESVAPAYASFDGDMFAGSLPIDHSNGKDGTLRTGLLQFWLFVPHHPSAPNTMVSWFNGGPGCSSFSAGVLFEHGPVTVPLHPAGWCCEDARAPLVPNEHGWTRATVMLYVEQPIGVGFSRATHGTPAPASEDDVAADFDVFLQNFYKIFNGDSSSSSRDDDADLTNHKLYLVGESYAGIYIPSIARGIYRRNKRAAAAAASEDDDEQPSSSSSRTGDRFLTPLAGMAIGNGKIDALTQDPAVIDFAYWHALIDGPTRDIFHEQWESCVAAVRRKDGDIGGALPKEESSSKEEEDDESSPFHPFSVRDDCGVLGALLSAGGADAFEKLPSGPNLYEYSTWDPYEAADGAQGTVGLFYNNLEVQKALNVPPERLGKLWEGCVPEDDAPSDERRRRRRRKLTATNATTPASSASVHRQLAFMDRDTPWSVVPYIAELLDDAEIDVLIYSGDRDIICCTQGSEDALRKMDWSGTQDDNPWLTATRSLWVYNDSYPAGYTRSYKNLNLLTIYNAGHMVPYNQPGPALDMMHRFLTKQSFHDRPLTSFHGPENPKEESQTRQSFQAEELLEDAVVGGAAASSTWRDQMNLWTVTLFVGTVGLAFLLGFGVARIGAPVVVTTVADEETAKLVQAAYGSL